MIPPATERQPRIGTFIKTPSPHVVELLALANLDFAVIDAEHAPFGRESLDIMILAGRAAGLSLLVRIPDGSASTILGTLDLGAAGIIVPHVDSAAQAEAIVRRAKYLTGDRGFSNGPRAAGYGTRGFDRVIADGNLTKVICQIESGAAVEAVEAIAATDGVDALMIGRADLALSLGLTRIDHPDVTQATFRAIDAARASGKAAVIVGGRVEELDPFVQRGCTVAIVSSDQGFLRSAAAACVTAFRARNQSAESEKAVSP